MDEILRWLPVVTLLIQGVVVWAVWSLKQQFVSAKDCGKIRARCGNDKDKADTDASARLKNLETSLPALPSRTEFQLLTDKIEKLTEKLGTVDGRLGGINRAVDLLNEHHLKGE